MTKRIRFGALALAALVALCLSPESRAQNAAALVRVRLSRECSQRALAARDVEIVHVYPDGRADLAVTEEQLAWLSSLGVSAQILHRAAPVAPSDLAAPAELDANLGLYHTYAEMNAEIDALAAAYPSLTHIDTLGVTYEGRFLRALKISDNADADEDEPEAFIFGCLHARELMSVEMPLLFARYLLERYATDPRVAAIVDGREAWIAPMMNPDGHVYVELNHGGASYNWWRKNRRPNGDGTYGVDLNRNFGYMWAYDNIGSSPLTSSVVYRGPAPFSELETQAVRDFCAARDFTVNVSYHSYGGLILYPWGYAALFTPDQELFQALGDTLASGSGYLAGNTATGAIYVTNGGSDDWMYGDTTTKPVVTSYTVELNSYEQGGFSPPDTLIAPTFDLVLELNLRILEYADEPRRVLGPLAAAMNDPVDLDAPAYEVSWEPSALPDPNPAVAWELVEYENLGTAVDSCEAGDALWTATGFALSTTRASAGLASWYGGRGNGLHNYLAMETVYPAWAPATLSCRLWYDIEVNWDYAYLQASLDGGATWRTLPGSRTTNYNPNGTNLGNGITGSSGGAWVAATFDLSSVLGADSAFALLRFAYVTDSDVNNEGIYVDLVDPVARCDARTVLGTSIAGTSYHRYPSRTGAFAYLVRGVDAEGDRGRWSDLAVRVVDDLSGSSAPPPRAALAQNYPNPFNPSTTIAFTVGEGAAAVPVRLDVYDVAGRLVARLVDRPLAPGAHRVVWNGRDARGRPVAAGVYLARLRIAGESFARKLVLVR